MRPPAVDGAHQGLLREPLSSASESSYKRGTTRVVTECIENTFDSDREVPAGMKRCTGCGEVLPFDRFYKRKGNGRRAKCRTCLSDLELDRYHADPERARANHLKRTYGLTLEEYDALLDRQGGGCALCGALPEVQERALHVDHDHETGAVRGVLCSECNVGLGRFSDSPALLERAAVYVSQRDVEPVPLVLTRIACGCGELIDIHAVECPQCGQPRPRHLEGVDDAQTEGAA